VDDNGNGRITLALLSQKLDLMADKLDRIIEDQCKQGDLIHTMELRAVATDAKIEAVKKTADEAKNTADRANNIATWWNGANSILAVIAGYLGVRP